MPSPVILADIIQVIIDTVKHPLATFPSFQPFSFLSSPCSFSEGIFFPYNSQNITFSIAVFYVILYAMKRLAFGMLLFGFMLIGCQINTAPPVQKPNVIVEATAVPVVSSTPDPTEVPSPVPTETPTAEPTASPTPEPSEEERLHAYIAGMSLEDRIGQLCMFGFSGTSKVSSEFAELMNTYHIGNVILYGQNIERGDKDGGFARCLRLTDSIRAASPIDIPLLISTDVEGGNVTRFHWGKSLSSARTLGSKYDTELAKEQFAYIGEGLLSAGINVDLAPVLDVTKEPGEHFLGKRIISSDAQAVADIGIACIEGLHEAGVLSVVKHYPGHGAANTDSHDKTPVVEKSIDSLRGYDFVPFRAAIQNGADGVMVAHILYTAIDDSNIATLSEILIQKQLREEYAYDGIVMCDDFRMAGLRKQASLDKAAVQFLLAGGDMILCGANHNYQKTILAGLYSAYENGILTDERINESVFRILTAKMRVTDWTVPY